MRIIKCLVKSMKDELDDAEKYYKKAVEYKELYPQVASVFVDLASQELQHCDRLHASAVSTINKYRESGKDVPSVMMEIWEYEHGEVIEWYDELKYKISKFTI